MADYPRSDLLVETAWLAERLGDPNVRVVEMAQDGSSFEGGHIPGASLSPTWQIKGSVNTRLVAPADEAKAWFESVGIGDDTLVVGYDRFLCRDAARLWVGAHVLRPHERQSVERRMGQVVRGGPTDRDGSVGRRPRGRLHAEAAGPGH